MLTQPTIQRRLVKRVSIWFYIIAVFQILAAYLAWTKFSAVPQVSELAVAGIGLDLAIAALFVVFGYFAAKAQTWAFVAGIILYALRAVLQFFLFFSLISLVIRLYLLFRIYQGLQACLQLNQSEALLNKLNAR